MVFKMRINMFQDFKKYFKIILVLSQFHKSKNAEFA